jgi:hypothetical protein
VAKGNLRSKRWYLHIAWPAGHVVAARLSTSTEPPLLRRWNRPLAPIYTPYPFCSTHKSTSEIPVAKLHFSNVVATMHIHSGFCETVLNLDIVLVRQMNSNHTCMNSKLRPDLYYQFGAWVLQTVSEHPL